MPTSSSAIDSTPHKAARLPFASEMGVQRFVEKHAQDILGVAVVASAQRGGGRLFNIDILAPDKTGRPVIIECKWDSVATKAFDQLAKYKVALRAGWNVSKHAPRRDQSS
jgi:RecB family endonuclease NucS